MLFLFYVFSTNLFAVEMSPKGRIDILNEQERQKNGNSAKDLVFKTNKPFKPAVIGKAYVAGDVACEVEISTSYFQAGDEVKVEAQIDNKQCGPSNGKYTVKVRTRDEAGESHTSKHQEVWSRDDQDSIVMKHIYSMNGDAELISARVQMPSKDYCTCINTVEEAPEED